MCMGGAAVGPSVLMNFYDADFQKFPQCKCSVEVKSGTFLSLNEVFAPEGLKCGTSITIKDDSEDIRHIINCNGETTVKYLQRGQVIKFILNRHFWDADANYCYRLNMGKFSKATAISSFRFAIGNVVTLTLVEIES